MVIRTLLDSTEMAFELGTSDFYLESNFKGWRFECDLQGQVRSHSKTELSFIMNRTEF